jgi:5-methylcytosine-specific restriction enzyme subunit McrC
VTAIVHELVEYERRELEMEASVARDLVRLAGDRIRVTPTTVADRFLIEATQHVGVVVLPELEILIRPKVNLDNLFLLLGVGMPPAAWRREIFGFGEAPHLLPGFAAFFARATEAAIARGLLHAYVEKRERVPAIRGRIDFVGVMRQPGIPHPIACRFDDYTADVIENRALKAAIRTLLRLLGVPLETRRVLMRSLAAFEEVRDEAIDATWLDRVIFTRLNRHYEPALRLADLVLSGTSLIDRPGRRDATAFLIDMNDLFQRFVTAELRRRLRGSLTVESEPPVKLDVHGKVRMRPDLVFRRGREDVYVGDTKYKLTGSGLAHNPDFYQLLAYTTAMDLPEGVLVYCQSDQDQPPRSIDVLHGGRRLFTYLIDLSGPPKDVNASIDQLAGWVSARQSSVPLRRAG